jgi:hypothetical protein
LPEELKLRQIVRGSTYVIERFRARSPVMIRIDPTARIFAPGWRFLFENPDARFQGL